MTGEYDPRLLALSVLIAMSASFTALNLVQRVTVSRGMAARLWLSSGAAAVGAALWSAQFFWMRAYVLPVPVVHHLPTMLFSLGFAVVVWFFALWIVSGPRISGLKLLVAGLCTGTGIAGVHYTGVFAMQIIPAVFYDSQMLAASIGIGMVVSALALWVAYVLRQSCTLPMLIARAGGGVLIGMGVSAVYYTGMAAARFAPDTYSLGAVASEDPGQGAGLVVIAVAAVLVLLAVMLLTIIDHTRQFAAAHAPGNTSWTDWSILEDRFIEMHEHPVPGRMIALMVVDVGQPGAESLLQEVGRRLAALVRPGDTVARREDGQFVLLLAGLTEKAQVERITQRVRDEVGREIISPASRVSVSPAIGCCVYPDDGEDLDTLLRISLAARSRQ